MVVCQTDKTPRRFLPRSARQGELGCSATDHHSLLCHDRFSLLVRSVPEVSLSDKEDKSGRRAGFTQAHVVAGRRVIDIRPQVGVTDARNSRPPSCLALRSCEGQLLPPASGRGPNSRRRQEQAVSTPKRPVPNERRRRQPPHGRRTGTTGEWPPAPRRSPPAPAKDRPGHGEAAQFYGMRR